MAKPMTAKFKGVCKYDLCDGDRRIEAGEPVKWLGKGNGVMHWDCAVECGADQIVVQVVAGETVTYNPPKPTGKKVKCDEGCGGTGQFVTGVVNGKLTGPGGIHFRCNGKGWQNDADRIRNYWYDVKFRKVYA